MERYAYDAYGEPQVYEGVEAGVGETGMLLTTSRVGNPYLHQGLRRDGETGLHENRFRSYNSRLGRFMQRDPVGYVDSMNLYEVYLSSAYAFVDPLGLMMRNPGGAGSRWLDIKITTDGRGRTTISILINGTVVAQIRLNVSQGADKLGVVSAAPGKHPKDITGEQLQRLVQTILLATGKAVLVKTFQKIMGPIGIFLQTISIKDGWGEPWQMLAEWRRLRIILYIRDPRTGQYIRLGPWISTEIIRIYFQQLEKGMNDMILLRGEKESCEEIAGKIKSILEGLGGG